VTIRKGGSVGIGTSTPAATLQVSGSLIVSSTLTNLTPSLYAGTDGRVGLGTATPSNTLHIKGAGWGANSPSILIQTSGVAYVGLGFYDDGTYAGVQSSQRTLFLSSRNSNNPVWLRSYWGGVDTNQYWGRGGTLIASSMPNSGVPGNHTEPSATLHVSGTIRIADSGEACDGNRAGAIRYTSQSTFEFCKGSGWQSMAAAGGASFDRIVSGSTSVIASEDRSLTISTAGSQRVIVGENGRIGIGTAAPAVSLHVSSSGSGDAFKLQRSDAGGFLEVGFASQWTNFNSDEAYVFKIDGTERARIATGGNVGIGTNAPSSALHAVGDLTIQKTATTSTTDRLQISHNGTTAVVTNLNSTSAVYDFMKFAGTSNDGSTPVSFAFDTAGQIKYSGNTMRFAANGVQVASIGTSGYGTGNNRQYLFSFDANPGGVPDTGLGRFSAGILKATNGSSGYGDFWANAVSATTIDATGAAGTVSATFGYFRYISGTQVYGTFVGDGSGLTGVTAGSSDRIVSGSTAQTRMVAISDTGYISITQAGANAGWFDPYRGLVTLGVSATGPISGTNGYFGNPTATSAPLVVNHFNGDAIRIDESGIAAGSANTSRLSWYANGSVRAWIGMNSPLPSSFGLLFATQNGGLTAERVRIDYNGNVGVGTQSPTATMQVSGSFIVSTSAQTTTPSLYVGGSGKVGIGTSSGSAMLEISPTTSSVVPLVLYQAQNASEALGFSYGPGLKGGNIRLVSGGGPVIGGNPYVDIGHISLGHTSIARFSTAYTGVAGLTLYPSDTQAGLNVKSGGKFSANFAQSVGIGLNMPEGGITTWAPSTSLHVSGTIRIADGGEACDGDRAGGIRYTSQSTFEFCKGSGWQSIAAVAGAAGDRIVSGTSQVLVNEDRSITVSTAGSDRMIVGENGYVGIGTATPLSQLHLARQRTPGYGQLTLGGASNNAGFITFLNPFGIQQGSVGYVSTTDSEFSIVSNGGGGYLTIDTGGSERARILNGGNVGIATQSPTATLQVSGSFIVSTSAQNNTPTLWVGSNGNVGIGVSNASRRLAVRSYDGTTALYAENTINGGSDSVFSLQSLQGAVTYGGFGQMLITRTSEGYAVTPLLALRARSGGQTANLQEWQNGSGAVLSVVSDDGRMSIGTGAPSTSLHVSGTIRIADGGEPCDSNRTGAIRYTSQSTFEFCKGSGWQSMAAAGGASSDRIVSGTTSVIASEDRSVTISTAGLQRVVIDERGEVTIGGVEINTQDGGSYALRTNLPVKASGFYFNDPVGSIFSNGGVRHMTFDASGQVGVGTTAPSATLHVSGTIKVAGTGAEACDANMRGGMRRNPSTGLMELCQ
jgi:hypothetical protein